MKEIKSSIVYFEKNGRDNTQRVLELVKQRAKELGISNILVASTTGYSGCSGCKRSGRYENNCCQPCGGICWT